MSLRFSRREIVDAELRGQFDLCLLDGQAKVLQRRHLLRALFDSRPPACRQGGDHVIEFACYVEPHGFGCCGVWQGGRRIGCQRVPLGIPEQDKMCPHDVHEAASGAAYRGSIGCEIREPAGYPRRAMLPATIS